MSAGRGRIVSFAFQVALPQGMHDSNSTWEHIKFGVQGRSPGGEVQEAGGGLLLQGAGAHSPRMALWREKGFEGRSPRRGCRSRAKPRLRLTEAGRGASVSHP